MRLDYLRCAGLLADAGALSARLSRNCRSGFLWGSLLCVVDSGIWAIGAADCIGALKKAWLDVALAETMTSNRLNKRITELEFALAQAPCQTPSRCYLGIFCEPCRARTKTGTVGEDDSCPGCGAKLIWRAQYQHFSAAAPGYGVGYGPAWIPCPSPAKKRSSFE